MVVRMLTAISGSYFDSSGVSHEWPARLGEVDLPDATAEDLIRTGLAVNVMAAPPEDVPVPDDAPPVPENDDGPPGDGPMTVDADGE